MKGGRSQQVITVFKHGPKPRRMCRVLVSHESSLETVKVEISKELGISKSEPVILNTIKGLTIASIIDILNERSNIIVASYPGEFDIGVYQRRAPPKGAYQRVQPQPRTRVPQPQRLPPMSKTTNSRLPPLAGKWDTAEDGGGDHMMQRRVGYERQMKKEYNARHNNRMNRLRDESAMEVSDILLSRERKMRAEHQIRAERRQKLMLKHLNNENKTISQTKRQQLADGYASKNLNNRTTQHRREYDRDVVKIFTKPKSGYPEIPTNLNKHAVLPALHGKPHATYSPRVLQQQQRHQYNLDHSPKRRKDETPHKTRIPVPITKTPAIPAKTPIPAIKVPRKPFPEVLDEEREVHYQSPRSHISGISPRVLDIIASSSTPDVNSGAQSPISARTENTDKLRPSTPIRKPSTCGSRKLSTTSGIDSLPVALEDDEEEDRKPKSKLNQKLSEDLGYDSPTQTPKHAKLSILENEGDEDIKLPTKLTQRDSGLADSIEPDSADSQRQSITPHVDGQKTPTKEENLEDNAVSKLDPVTEETESEAPQIIEVPKFKRMLEIFDPKPDYQLNSTFVMGKTLGDGNFAVVKTGLNKETAETVAIKIIDKEKLKGKENMMINEIEIMKKLDCPYCVKLYDIYENEPHIYLVTELVKDGDLFDCIVKNRCFAEVTVRKMMIDMVSGLDYMHCRNIVHRDIKPENIFVHRQGGRYNLKLGDFGLSMVVTEPLFTICGTPTYIAPEILVECGYSLEIDLWAIGVINYILLCGFPPFRSKNKNQEELFSLIMSGEFQFVSPYWDKVTKSAKDLITKLLQVIPEDRYTTRQVLKHPWIRSIPINEE